MIANMDYARKLQERFNKKYGFGIVTESLNRPKEFYEEDDYKRTHFFSKALVESNREFHNSDESIPEELKEWE